MTVQQYTLEYSTDGATWTMLSNLQDVNIKIGRQNLQDTFSPSNASFTLRYPTGFSSPITALIVGSYVRVKRVGMSAIYNSVWLGTIRDVTVEYGIPYADGVAPADYLTIVAEGALARAGRAQGNDYVIDSDYADVQLADAAAASGVNMDWEDSFNPIQQLAASTVEGSYAEWLNNFVGTIGASINDGGSVGTIGVRPRDHNADISISFSDTTNDATHQVYDNIKFDSLSEDYYNSVEINTNTVGNVVVSTGSAPYRTLRLPSYNLTTGQAEDLGQYLLGVYSTPNFGISEISCLAEAQNTMALELGTFWWSIVGATTSVLFRGQTFYVNILGASISATPSSARYTYYLADADMTPYLVLDSASFGILDTNKLGW